MGLQKYRADTAGQKQSNGGTPYYTNWIGGPTLALVRECAIENAPFMPVYPKRTVYVRGEADTYSSIPAACLYKRKTITGYITTDDAREYVFRAHTGQGV
jgi:hypothetical protein